MKHLLAALALAAACGSSGAKQPPPPEPAPPSPVDHVARIEAGLLPAVQVAGEDVRTPLADRMRELHIPAVSIAVFDDYELVWAKAYGLADVDGKVAADAETTFLAGSISKSVNALGVLLAAADGVLALDAPVNDALTSWKLPDNDLTRATPVTLRMLLSHTGGTTVHGFPGYAAGAPIPTVPQILDGKPPANTAPVRVDLAPGTEFRYSGGGTTISQLALTERSGQRYPEVLATRVLGPLAMTHSSFEQQLTPERLRHAAVGHDGAGAAIPGLRNAYPEMGAAGLWTTPTDLARFFLAIARARAGRPSPVPPAIATQMTTQVKAVNGLGGVGLGVFLRDVNGAKYFGHGGSDAGFQADALASLDGGRGVVIMTNSDNGSRIFEEIERTVFAEYGWPGAAPVYTRVAMTPAQRAALVGRYLDGGVPVVIEEVGGKLQRRTPFAPPAELVELGGDGAVQRETGERVRAGADHTLEVGREVVRTLKPLGDARHPLLELEAGRFDDAVAAWRDLARTDAAASRGLENFVNSLGYRLMPLEVEQAVLVLRLVSTALPDSANAHDSLGEAYLNAGDTARSIAEYQEALRTLDADPRLDPADRPILRAHMEAQLKKLRQP